MVASPDLTDLPYITLQGLGPQPRCDEPCEFADELWSTLGFDNMADEMYEHAYTDELFQDRTHQHLTNMQRFLQEKETYFAGRRVFDEQHPQLSGGNQSPIAVGFYGSGHPWPQNIDTTHSLYPQESWDREWPLSDQETCSATTGQTWSSTLNESCPGHDPRYPPWPEHHVYPAECIYPSYGAGFVHKASVASSHSITGTLSEIQQCPDTEAEDDSIKGRVYVPNSTCSDAVPHPSARTMNFHRDEGIGSSINESAIASPVSQTENTTMESINSDDEESDYSPQHRSKRGPEKQKGRPKTNSKASASPNSKRTSMTKGDPHQLTSPAKITKRASSTAKSNSAMLASTSPHNLQITDTNDSVCQQCRKSFPSGPTLAKHVLSTHTRPFHCSFRRYGCTSTFGSKNEWKRHVSSQHLCPGIYRCDIGACVPRPTPSSLQRSDADRKTSQQTSSSSSDWSHNDFNRKDLFTQHIRRMHGPGSSISRLAKENFENGLEAIRRRCWIPLRDTPPRSMCGYCAPHSSRPSTSDCMAPGRPVVFSGKGSWDDRMEHVGRHLEKEDPGIEVEDLELRDWMVGEKLLVWEQGGYVVTGLGGRRRSGRGNVKEEVDDGERDGEGEEDADGEDE